MTESPDEQRSEQFHPAGKRNCDRAADSDEMPRFRFEDLAAGSRRVKISWGETVYELRLTRNGRLVLHK